MRSSFEEPLALPASEWAERLARVQGDLAACGLEAGLLFDPENIYWLTGYQTIGYFTFQCLYVPGKGKPTLISRLVNKALADVIPAIATFVPINDTDDPVAVLAGFLGSVLHREAPIGIETGAWYLTVRDFTALQGLIVNSLRPWNGFIEKQRAIKTAAQLDRIRWAARCAEAGMVAALQAIAPGRTENDVAAAMYQASIAAGSEYLGHPPLVVSGERSGRCFAMWRRRELRRGDIVLLENAGCIDRYHAMLARTAVLGQPSADQRRVADTSIAMLEAAIRTIRPGVTSGQVDAASRRVAEAAGLAKYSLNRTAYGIGIGFPPNWSEGRVTSLRARDPAILEPGMTFHIVGGALFLPDFGVIFSDSVAVTETGCEVLTTLPRRLTVIE